MARSGSNTHSPRSSSRTRRALFWVSVAFVGTLFVAWTRADSLRGWWLGRKSLSDLRMVAEASPRDLSVWSLYARRALAAGQGEAAVGAFEHVASLIPVSDTSHGARRLLADGAYAAARYGTEQQAESLAGRISGGPTDDLRGSLALGIFAMRRKDFKAAQESFLKAVVLSPKSAEAHSRLGTCLLAQEQPQAAVTSLQSAVTLSPQDAAMHADLGEALALSSRFKEAMAAYAEAARLQPDNADYAAQHALASASAARTDEEFEAASTLMVTAMQANPDDPALYLTIAGLQMRFARMDEARRSYEAAVGRVPDHADAWFNLSTVYLRLGDRDSAAFARSRFQEILDRQTAVVELTKQSLLRPRDAMLMSRLSAAMRRAGDARGAYRTLQKAAALDPGNARLQETLKQATHAISGGGVN